MKRICFLFGILIILSLYLCPGLSETVIRADGDYFLSGEEIFFHIGSDYPVFRYSMSRDGETIIQDTETTIRDVAYIPRETGDYQLSVLAYEPNGGVEESAEYRFTVTGACECTLTADKTELSLGDAVVLSGTTPMDADGLVWSFSVFKENERIWASESNDSECLYVPDHTGFFYAVLKVTDRKGNTAEAGISFTVNPGNGLYADGENSTFYLYGGIRSWRITGGFWEASCNDDHFRLLTSAGSDGDELIVLAEPDEEKTYNAILTVRSSDSCIMIPLRQIPEDDVEEELSLYGDPETGSGRRLLFLQGNETVREITVFPEGIWHAFSDQSEVCLQEDGNILTITVPENHSAVPEYYHIRVKDNGRDAHVVILQDAEHPKAAIGEIVQKEAGTPVRAYADHFSFLVSCSENTDELCVQYEHGNTWRFDISEKDHELFEISIPAVGSGEQVLLFTPVSSGQSGIPAMIKCTVLPEEPFVKEACISVRENETILNVLTTAGTKEIILTDSEGQQTAVHRSQASVDRYVDSENLGRFSRWSILLPEGISPVSCKTGNSEIRITYLYEYPEQEKSSRAYDQMNGLWKYVPYRDSNLQTSGCAIFTLSTALKLLGYEGEETEPGVLAETYRHCLVEGGTLNSTLVGNAAKDFGFQTNYNLYQDKQSVIRFFERGAVFSFSPVKGHIALADRISDDGQYIHIIDSAISATFTRLPEGRSMYTLSDSGVYIAIDDLSQIEGARYYLETDAYSGGEYWLESGYVLWRGVRLILPK